MLFWLLFFSPSGHITPATPKHGGLKKEALNYVNGLLLYVCKVYGIIGFLSHCRSREPWRIEVIFVVLEAHLNPLLLSSMLIFESYVPVPKGLFIQNFLALTGLSSCWSSLLSKAGFKVRLMVGLSRMV